MRRGNPKPLALLLLPVFVGAIPNSVAGATASQMDTSSTSPGPTVREAMRVLPRVSENNRVVRCVSRWRVTASSISMIWIAAAFGAGFAASMAPRLGPMVGRIDAHPDSSVTPMVAMTQIPSPRRRSVTVARSGASLREAVCGMPALRGAIGKSICGAGHQHKDLYHYPRARNPGMVNHFFCICKVVRREPRPSEPAACCTLCRARPRRSTDTVLPWRR